MPINPINPGERIRATWLNEIVQALNGLKTTGDKGKDPLTAALALVLTALNPEIFIPVRIMGTRRNHDWIQVFNNTIPPRPFTQAYPPSQITYDVQAIRGPWRVDDVSPVFGRDVRNDEAVVYPAHTGLIAFMVRAVKMRSAPGEELGEYTADLMLLPGSEVVARRRCPSNLFGPTPGGFNIPLPMPIPLPDTMTGKGLGSPASSGSEASSGSDG